MKLELNHWPAAEPNGKPPLLFVHGMAHAAWCWEWNFVPFFNALGYDCYTISLRGHGKSDGHNNIRWHRIAHYVQDVEWAISQTGSRPILIGHSMGGFILQKYLLEKDDAPAVVTLAGVPAGGMLKGSLKIARHFPWAFIKGNLILSTAPFSESEHIIKTIAFSKGAPDTLITRVKEAMEPESYMAYLDMMFLNLHTPRKVKTPALFLYAANDFIVDREGWTKTAAGFSATAEIVDDIAHDMFLDVRWKDAASRISNWLKSINL